MDKVETVTFEDCCKCKKVVKCPDCMDLEGDNANLHQEKWDNYHNDIVKDM